MLGINATEFPGQLLLAPKVNLTGNHNTLDLGRTRSVHGFGPFPHLWNKDINHVETEIEIFTEFFWNVGQSCQPRPGSPGAAAVQLPLHHPAHHVLPPDAGDANRVRQ